MALLLGAEASPNNGSDAPATPAPPKPAPADAHLGVMDEDEAVASSANSAGAADVMPERDTETTAEDQHTTGDEPAAETLDPAASLEKQSEAADEPETDADTERDDLPRGVRRKLSRQAERIERLEQELEEERAKKHAETAPQRPDTATAAPVTDAEVALHTEIDTLRARRSRISEAIRRAAADGESVARVQFEGGQMVEASLADAEMALETLGDRLSERKDDLRGLRREREQQRTRVAELLVQRHPWTSDRNHPATAAIETVLRRYPALQQIPEARYWIASTMAFEYLTAPKAAENGANKTNGTHTNGKPAPPPPRSPARATRPAAAPLAVNGAKAQLGAAQQRFAKTGDERAGKELIGQLLAS